MTYLPDGQVGAVLSRRGAAVTITVGSMVATVVAPAAATGGRYSLYRLDLAANAGGAAPHVHRGFAESFLVLSGVVELFDGAQWTPAHEGDHLFVPESGVHGFRNERAQAASMLMMSTPAAPREGYFAELAWIVAEGAQLTPKEWTRLCARHDQYMV